jgi:hypothetical protein
MNSFVRIGFFVSMSWYPTAFKCATLAVTGQESQDCGR